MKINWITKIPTAKELAFWIEQKYNVLFIGNHGIGKTTLVSKAFSDAGLDFKYFSAPTMDPWVDFIGVPKELSDEKGEYLGLVKPKEFRDDKYQALFFDEYNRAPLKVQNAVMELIQFKSINGANFENLQMIWAAINDSDSGTSFNVNELDYAQLDRFHIIVKLPSEPQKKFFEDGHGELGTIICDWWQGLSKENKEFVSPRRLDYVLDIFKKGGDISLALPICNSNELKKGLAAVAKYAEFIEVLTKSEKEIKTWCSKASNIDPIIHIVIQKNISTIKYLSEERVKKLFLEAPLVKSHIETFPSDFEFIRTGHQEFLNMFSTVFPIPNVPGFDIGKSDEIIFRSFTGTRYAPAFEYNKSKVIVKNLIKKSAEERLEGVINAIKYVKSTGIPKTNTDIIEFFAMLNYCLEDYDNDSIREYAKDVSDIVVSLGNYCPVNASSTFQTFTNLSNFIYKYAK